MKIAVTGAGGQLGTELCRQIGSDAIGLDLPQFDLTDRHAVLRMLTEIQPEAVVNTAAYTQVDKAEEEDELCRAVNARGVTHLVEACRRLDCSLLHVSTDYVFSGRGRRRIPYRETDEPDPQGVYALTKLEGERIAGQWERHFIVRTCGLYGRPGSRSGGNFVETMLQLAAKRKHLSVVDDQHCTPSYVSHVARAIRFLVGTQAHGTYHVVNSGETTWYDVAAEIFRIQGLDVQLEPISTAEYAARAFRPSYSVLDTSKYRALPDAPSMPAWQDALREYMAAREE